MAAQWDKDHAARTEVRQDSAKKVKATIQATPAGQRAKEERAQRGAEKATEALAKAKRLEAARLRSKAVKDRIDKARKGGAGSASGSTS